MRGNPPENNGCNSLEIKNSLNMAEGVNQEFKSEALEITQFCLFVCNFIVVITQ